MSCRKNIEEGKAGLVLPSDSHRREVRTMDKKESPCGYGCISAKPSINKSAKSLKEVEVKETKNQKSKETKSN